MSAMARLTASPNRAIWVHFLLYPGHTLPTALAPVLVGIGLAVHDHVFAWLPALLAFVTSWLIHVGGVLCDNYLLLTKHPEIREHPELTGAVADGSLRLDRLRAAIIACFVLAAAFGPTLARIAGPAVAVYGAIGAAASLLYSTGPRSLVRLGIAEPVFFLMFGVVAVAGTYFVQAVPAHGLEPSWTAALAVLTPAALLLGLPTGALVTNVLIIDDIRDHRFDQAKGWRTAAVRFGVGCARRLFVALAAFAYLAPLWFWRGLGFGPSVLLPLVTLPLGLAITRAVWTIDRREDLLPMTPRGSLLSAAYSALLAIGVALG
jgi:1,4-dihydroxy-2-naphthoate octaprenyltransferase